MKKKLNLKKNLINNSQSNPTANLGDEVGYGQIGVAEKFGTQVWSESWVDILSQCPGSFWAYRVSQDPSGFFFFLFFWRQEANWPTPNDPSDSKFNQLHVDIFRFLFYSFEVYCLDSSRIVSEIPEVLNSNRLCYELDRFICNSPPVLPGHKSWSSTKVSHGAHGLQKKPMPTIRCIYCGVLMSWWNDGFYQMTFTLTIFCYRGQEKIQTSL